MRQQRALTFAVIGRGEVGELPQQPSFLGIPEGAENKQSLTPSNHLRCLKTLNVFSPRTVTLGIRDGSQSTFAADGQWLVGSGCCIKINPSNLSNPLTFHLWSIFVPSISEYVWSSVETVSSDLHMPRHRAIYPPEQVMWASIQTFWDTKSFIETRVSVLSSVPQTTSIINEGGHENSFHPHISWSSL